MSKREKTLGEIIFETALLLQKIKERPLRLLEIGCSRHVQPGAQDPVMARSTYAIGTFLKEFPKATAISVDFWPEHIRLCDEMLNLSGFSDARTQGRHSLICSDGATALKSVADKSLDLVCLDGDSCEKTTYAEYLEVLRCLEYPAIVIIDDINRNNVNKGAHVIEHLFRKRRNFWMLSRWVMAVGYGSAAEDLLDRYTFGAKNVAK